MAQHHQPPSSTATEQRAPYSATPGERAPRSLTQRLAITLLTNLPRSLAEAGQRVSPVPLKMARGALIMMIEEGSLTAWEGDRLSPLFKVIGVGSEVSRLSELAKFSACEEQRAQALAALFHSEEGQRLFHLLTDEERVTLSSPWVRPMMALASEDHFPRFALTALFESTAPSCQASLLRQFERCRVEVSGCAKSAYEVLIRQEGLTTEHLELLFGLIGAQGQLASLEDLSSEWSPQTRAVFTRVTRGLKRAQVS